MSIALWLGFALPWWLGTVIALSLSRGPTTLVARGRFVWLFGCGWFIGILLLTLWMRVLSGVNVSFSIPAIAGPIALAAAAISWRLGRRTEVRFGAGALSLWRAARLGELPHWQRVLWYALLAWIGFRFALLLIEVLNRPLYAWDAWSHWGTKARVWFEMKRLVPFVSPAEWLTLGGSAYTDANPHYPAMVPLMQVWGAMLAGTWDDVAVNLPWWLTGIAFALAVYGFLAQRGLPPLWALIGTWMVTSLPVLDVHVALAGYADLPMAAYFTLAVLAGWRWTETHEKDDLWLAVLFMIACVLVKNPGKAWILVLVPGAVVAMLPRYGLRLALAGLAAAIVTMVVIAHLDLVLFGYRLHLDFMVPWRGLVDAYLMFANWHLLWYAAIAAALLGRRQLMSPQLAPLTVVIAGGMLFLSFAFVFTNAREWVEDQSTVNRATLHMAPLIAIWSLLVFRMWSVKAPQRPDTQGAADQQSGFIDREIAAEPTRLSTVSSI